MAEVGQEGIIQRAFRQNLEDTILSMTRALYIQTAIYFIALLALVFWYRTLSVILEIFGVAACIAGAYAMAYKNIRMLEIFIALQTLGCIISFAGLFLIFMSITHYKTICNEGNSDQPNCPPFWVFYGAALFAPLQFVALLFAAIYAARLRTLVKYSAQRRDLYSLLDPLFH